MPKNSATATRRRRPNDETLEVAAQRRSEHAVVRRYLDALEQRRSRRGRSGVDPARLEARLADVVEELVDAGPVQRVQLIQERMDLEGRLGQVDAEVGETLEDLEEGFVAVGAEWAQRKGISYRALRTGAGVPAAVLRRAGIDRVG